MSIEAPPPAHEEVGFVSGCARSGCVVMVMFVMLLVAYFLTDNVFATYKLGEGWQIEGFFFPTAFFFAVWMLGSLGILAVLERIPGIFTRKKK